MTVAVVVLLGVLGVYGAVITDRHATDDRARHRQLMRELRRHDHDV